MKPVSEIVSAMMATAMAPVRSWEMSSVVYVSSR